MNTAIDLRRLWHAALLDEERNFTRAAERARLSQPAFSRSILALEADLGLRLFDRATRSVATTHAGRQVIARARRLLANAVDLDHEVRSLAHAEGGELSFGASQMAIDTVLRGVLPALIRQSPRLRLDVEVTHWQLLRQSLELERIEFFVAYADPLLVDPAFEITPLAPAHGSIFCRPGHPLAEHAEPPRPQQLVGYPWGVVQMPAELGDRLRLAFDMAPDDPLPVALACASQPLLRETMLSSDTILMTWSAWLKDDVDAGRVVDLGARLQPALPATLTQLRTAIVRLAGRTLSPTAQRMIALIVGRNAAAQARSAEGAGQAPAAPEDRVRGL